VLRVLAIVWWTGLVCAWAIVAARSLGAWARRRAA